MKLNSILYNLKHLLDLNVLIYALVLGIFLSTFIKAHAACTIHRSPVYDSAIGRVSTGGQVYLNYAVAPVGFVEMTGPLTGLIHEGPAGNGPIIGRVDKEGRLYDSEFGGFVIGHLAPTTPRSFMVHRGSATTTAPVGHATDCDVLQAGGGALLLLF